MRVARHSPPDQPPGPEDPPREAQITVLWDAPRPMARHPRTSSWLVIAVGLLALLVAGVYGGVLQRYRRPEHRPVAQLQWPTGAGLDVLVGPDALAAAFRETLRCHTLTFAASDPSYFRAQPARTGPCRDNGPAAASIYRRVDREFRLVLNMSRYSCPVASLPVLVQIQLRVCPQAQAY